VRLACKGPPPPADFAARAAGMSNLDLADHYDVGTGTVARWRREAGVTAPGSHSAICRHQAPPDFARVAPTKTRYMLALHYRRGVGTIDRWCAEARVSPRPGQGRGTPVRIVSGSDRAFSPVEKPHRDLSPAGRAVDFLRRFGPVTRCDAEGRHDAEGTHYRRGAFVLTGDELIARALRLGHDSDVWRRLA
jgi:hypothetical protein